MADSLRFLNRKLRTLKNLIFPPRCMFCRKLLPVGSEMNGCLDCMKSLPYVEPAHCPVCGRVTPTGEIVCWRCSNKKPYYQKHVSACYYEKGMKNAITAFKFRGKMYYYKDLGAILANYVYRPEAFDFVTSVPISVKRMRERGYNQSELLARRICEIGGLEYKDTLRRIKDRIPQNRLNYEQRQRNVRGAFAVVDDVKMEGKSILLVDDIFTTGATMNECARVLGKAGAASVFGLTLAMTKLQKE